MTIEDQKAGVRSTAASIFKPATDFNPKDPTAIHDLANQYKKYFQSQANEGAGKDLVVRSDRHDENPFELSQTVANQLATIAQPANEERQLVQREKDYDQGKIGPVRREHFDEFVALMQRNDKAMRQLVMKAASKASEEKKARTTLEARFEAQNAKLAAYEKLYKADLSDIPALARDVARGKAREKQYKPTPSRDIPRPNGAPEEPLRRLEDQPDASEYLWPTLKDRVNEMTVEIMLTRCATKRAMRAYDEMKQKLHEVLEVARDLGYRPLIARCAFHVACYHFGVGNYRMAARRFEEARETEGHYREADEIKHWMIRVENKVREMDMNGESGGSNSGAKSAVADEFGGERLCDAVVHGHSVLDNHGKHVVSEKGRNSLSGESTGTAKEA